MQKLDPSLTPNPYFSRSETYSLNGEWDFKKDKTNAIPEKFERKIKVPFAVETKESGIGEEVTKDDFLHYRLSLNYPEEVLGKKARVVFTAVDQVADVYLNGVFLKHHEGGYLPFDVIIEETKAGDYLDLTTKDDTDSLVYPKGKQTSHPHGMFYQATSGIWGDVYMEILPKSGYISGFSLNVDYDKKTLSVKKLSFRGNEKRTSGKVFFDERLVKESNDKLEFDLSKDFHPWSPSTPDLYELKINYGEDTVSCFFGMRKFETKDEGGIKLFYLNDEPIYLNGLLDQGYFSPDSGLTPLNEESVLKELRYVKDCGFNFLRKHIKIESPRWYHLCDKLGIIVMQDFVSGGDGYKLFSLSLLPTIGFTKCKINGNANRKNEESQKFFEKEMPLFVDNFKNMTCVCLWCLFNEGWGQFDTSRLTDKLRSLDSSRPIDSASGWFDEKAGDIDSKHVYFRRPRLKNKGDRVLFLSEFGGYIYRDKEHSVSKKSYGYKLLSSPEKLLSSLEKAYLKQLVPLIEKQGLCGSVYTQLSDVEGEVNGLITYDRAVYKVPASAFKKINESVYKAFFDARKQGK